MTDFSLRNVLSSALVSLLVIGIGCDESSDKNAAAPSEATRSAAEPAGVTPTKKGTIGVSLLTLANPFFKEMGDAMTAEAAKSGFEVRITSAEMDPARQRDQVKDFIAAKVSAIVLTPADSKAVGTAIKEANEAGIPVFTADVASLAEGATVVSHIATDNYGGGVQAAQAIAEALNGKGTVAILDHPEVESVIQRTKGFETELAKTPNIKIIARLPGGGARDRSFKAAQDILQAHPDVSAIFAINDPSALGAVAALEAAGRNGKVVVVGFDGQPEAKKAVRDGRIYADAIQYPKKIGALTIEALVKYAAGEKVEPQTLIPTGLYKKADADQDPELK